MRKILHIDMDCFFAAIEVRDHPELRGKPVAVGGTGRRGVLTTANYEAREFGCRSAMPVFMALERCPHLILVAPRFEVYAAESRRVREIFRRFTALVEPLSLDEAYLDVSHLRTGGSAVAWEIRCEIFEESGLTASAGIAPNKMLAKIASDWRKPNGQFEIAEAEVDGFMEELPVKKLPGVGRRTEERLAAMGVQTCGDLQRAGKIDLAERFGKWGAELHELCRGRDNREVRPRRIRKSLSTERTFSENIAEFPVLVERIEELVASVRDELEAKHSARTVRALVVKLKFADFAATTAEQAHSAPELGVYRSLLAEAWSRGEGRAVRLLGVGVRFADPELGGQLDLGLV